MSGKTQERAEALPGQPHTALAVQLLEQPAFCRTVKSAIGIDRVDEEVGIDETMAAEEVDV